MTGYVPPHLRNRPAGAASPPPATRATGVRESGGSFSADRTGDRIKKPAADLDSRGIGPRSGSSNSLVKGGAQPTT